MKIKLNVEGNKAAIQGIKKATDSFKQYLEEEIRDTTQEIASKAIVRTPVGLSSFLKQSNYVNLTEQRGETGFTMKYAPYVEFGTGSEVDIPAGLEEYAMQFYVSGKGRLPARPFLFNSAFEEQVKLTEKLKKDTSGIK